MSFKTTIKTSFLVLAMTICGVASALPASAALTGVNGSHDVDGGVGGTNNSFVNSSVQQDVTGSSSTLMDQLQLILNVALGVIGFVAVVMIVIGGLQYTTSSGDAGKVTKAKNTIMYGVIGLVVALLAFAIVNFVLTNIF